MTAGGDECSKNESPLQSAAVKDEVSETRLALSAALRLVNTCLTALACHTRPAVLNVVIGLDFK